MRILRISLIICAALLVVLAVAGSALRYSSRVSAEPSNETVGWGMGPATDSANRPADAVAAEEKYREQGARFLLDKGICLTFDLGYENGYTAPILDAMLARGVKGVFFVTLDYCKEAPELVRRIIDEGHILGNHTAKHNSLPNVSAEKARDDVMRLHEYVLEQFGYEMSWFRFPCGEFSPRTLKLVSELGYESMFWSFAYVDWLVNDQPDPSRAKEKMLSAAHEGAIYLLHAVSSTNAAVMGEVLDGLRERGYDFVLPDAAAADGVINPDKPQ